MANQFQFHYVKTPTGTISGQSVLTQTEDAKDADTITGIDIVFKGEDF